jgi:pSer/pThr/pTyr-binding forkhead associated (FHA) protein
VSEVHYALRFVSGKYQGGEFPLNEGQEIVIGRSSELDMVLVEEMVARRHAKIGVRDGIIHIEDLGSTNGTFVNGERITRATLKPKDRILIGTSVMSVIAFVTDELVVRSTATAADSAGSLVHSKASKAADAIRAPSVFVSYRREDEPHGTERLVEALVQKLGPDAVFHDIDSIPLGVDFREHLTSAVRKCDICLVVIGRQWLTVKDEDGVRRLDKEVDFVRIEVEVALGLGRPVIPILVGAGMPRPQDLPESIRQLAYRNGTLLRTGTDFKADIARLLKAVERLLAGPTASS